MSFGKGDWDMLLWLSQNWGSLLVFTVIALLVAGSVRSLRRQKKAAKVGGCGGGCAGCPMCASCHGAHAAQK